MKRSDDDTVMTTNRCTCDDTVCTAVIEHRCTDSELLASALASALAVSASL